MNEEEDLKHAEAPAESEGHAQPDEAASAEQEAHAPRAPSRMDSLRTLVEFLRESGIVEYSSERAGEKLSLKFATSAVAAPAFDPALLSAMMSRGTAPAPPVPPSPATSATPPAEAPAAESAAPAAPAASDESTWHIVKSPIVGTFFESPSPGSPAFVQSGDFVENGQVLCIIEAMKLMNEIESDGSGEVVKRFVNNGQPVEYGQHLYALKPRG